MPSPPPPPLPPQSARAPAGRSNVDGASFLGVDGPLSLGVVGALVFPFRGPSRNFIVTTGGSATSVLLCDVSNAKGEKSDGISKGRAPPEAPLCDMWPHSPAALPAATLTGQWSAQVHFLKAAVRVYSSNCLKPGRAAMASAQKRNPSRPGSATTRPGSAKDSTRNAQAQAAESGVFRCSVRRASAPPVEGRRLEDQCLKQF